MKIPACLGHLGDALDLPGDLIDIVLRPKMLGVVASILALVELPFIEQRKRVMIAGVSAEEPRAGRLGDKKTQQVVYFFLL